MFATFLYKTYDKSEFVVQTCRVLVYITVLKSDYVTHTKHFGLYLPAATPTFLHTLLTTVSKSRQRCGVCVPSNSILFHYRCWFLWKHYRFRKTTLFNFCASFVYAMIT